MTSDIYADVLNVIETIFFCEHYKNCWNFTQSPSAETLRRPTVFSDPRAICPKICGNYPPTEYLHNRKSEIIPALYTVEATFAVIYLFFIQRRFKTFNKIYLIWRS